MLHAGVLMKLGGYGAFRVAIFLMPEAARELSWIFIILTSIIWCLWRNCPEGSEIY
jgi:NADH-quinone oxidoreductase subunit M